MSQTAPQSAAVAANPDWWRGAVIYQIYPRSFQDSDGDGIGDLRGIAQRLDHVAALGADAVWISPFFTSPMRDFGYDVSDYCDIDPMFGTLADFDAVVETAHRLGIRVIIDLVLSHTSDDHPWFAESRASRDNPKADWYVWADAKPDGTAPTNWLSVFGGPAWEWDTRREQYYMHNFLTAQPDLNYHEPAVRQAVLDVARFWLDRGVDGFRLDALNFYVHDDQLRDNPVLDPSRRSDVSAPKVNPYNYQEHLYDRNRPELTEFLAEFRALLDAHGAVAVGEIGDGQIGLELIGQYTAGNRYVQMCYAFDFLAPDRPDAAHLVAMIAKVEAATSDGWVCWAFSNHDCVRHRSRWSLSDPALRMFTALLMSLRGAVCLYQGEELGLTEAEIDFADLKDPYGIRFWPQFKGRDGCRTPMVWEDDAPQAGFSDGAQTWLPIPAAHLQLAVSVQEATETSLLHAYRELIALRHAHPALQIGALSDLAATGSVVHFLRRGAGETLFCAFNLSDEPARLPLPEGTWTPVGPEWARADFPAPDQIQLGPWASFHAELAT